MLEITVEQRSEDFCDFCMKRIDPTMTRWEKGKFICQKCWTKRMFQVIENNLKSKPQES